jgi:hypothetical protein
MEALLMFLELQTSIPQPHPQASERVSLFERKVTLLLNTYGERNSVLWAKVMLDIDA